jgi:transposase
MPKPYSVDLRKRIIHAYESGEGSQAEIAEKYQVGKATVERYWRLYQEKGDVLPNLEKPGRPSSIGEKDVSKIKAWIEAKPDITLNELKSRYNALKGSAVGQTTIHRLLVKRGFKRKKKSLYCSEQDRPDLKK